VSPVESACKLLLAIRLAAAQAVLLKAHRALDDQQELFLVKAGAVGILSGNFNKWRDTA
jgi:hypothetical protein